MKKFFLLFWGYEIEIANKTLGDALLESLTVPEGISVLSFAGQSIPVLIEKDKITFFVAKATGDLTRMHIQPLNPESEQGLMDINTEVVSEILLSTKRAGDKEVLFYINGPRSYMTLVCANSRPKPTDLNEVARGVCSSLREMEVP